MKHPRILAVVGDTVITYYGWQPKEPLYPKLSNEDHTDKIVTIASFLAEVLMSIAPQERVAAVALEAVEGYEVAEGAAQGAAYSRRGMGPAGRGLERHHIVEQNPTNTARFGPGPIQNTGNLFSLKTGLHGSISRYSPPSIRPYRHQ